MPFRACGNAYTVYKLEGCILLLQYCPGCLLKILERGRGKIKSRLSITALIVIDDAFNWISSILARV